MNHSKLCQCTHDSHTYPNAPTGQRCSKIREIRANNDLWLCFTCFDSLGRSKADWIQTTPPEAVGTTEEEPENRLRTLTLHADTYTDNRPTLARLQDAEITAWMKLGHLVEGREKGKPTVHARADWSWKGGEGFTFLTAIQERLEGEISALQAAVNFEQEATDRRKASGPIRCYAEAYRKSTAYGGAEEGGWSYTVYDLEETIPTWCHCDPMLVMDYYAEDEETGEPPTQRIKHAYYHEYNCEALTVLEDLEKNHRQEKPPTQEFTRSYITAGGTWDMDGPEDAPPDQLGEVIDRASRADYFKLSMKENEQGNHSRPRYA